MTANQKVALVTGANRGLGRSTALSLAREGVDVIVTYRSNAAEADAVVASIMELGRTAVALQLDTGAVDTFEAFVAVVKDALAATWGREDFDLLVNNAGTGVQSPFEQTPWRSSTRCSTSTSRACSSSRRRSLDS